MKTTSIYNVSAKQLRESVRAELSERIKYVSENLAPVIGAKLLEAYSDNPAGNGKTEPTYSREDVKAMLRSRGEVKKDTTLNTASEPTTPTMSGVKCGICDSCKREKSLSYTKDLYFKESEDDAGVRFIDYEDDSTADEEEFRNALSQAQSVNHIVEIQLNDGNQIDLDSESINKILASESLFHKTIRSFESLSSICETLGIKEPSEDGTHDDYYGENENVLLDKEFFVESVLESLSEKMPAAIYITAEDLFEDDKYVDIVQNMTKGDTNNKNRIERGRAVMVNRVRGGQLQLRKLVSNSKGFKITAGAAVRMKPSEIKKRRIGAKFAAKKRKVQQTGINRKTKLSLRFRARRLEN
jgi:hypothetical protein